MGRKTVVGTLVPNVIITADLLSPVMIAPVKGKVIAVSYTPRATITGAASTASRTFTLYNRGITGAGTTVMATLAMIVGVNATAKIAKPIPLSAVAGALNVSEGDVLEWESLAVTVAVGLVDPGGVVSVEIAPSLR